MATPKTSKLKIEEVKLNPTNPRIIKDDKFKKLVKSIKEFPEMLQLRPIVVDDDNIILGGNMRYRACIEAGLKEVYVIKAEGLTEQQKKEFIIKDNVGFGEWDWDELANNWELDLLDDWGLSLDKFRSEEPIESNDAVEVKWFLNIEFQTEHETQEWFDKLTQEGLICKIVQ